MSQLFQVAPGVTVGQAIRTLTPAAESLAGQRKRHLESAPGSVEAVLDVVETWHNDQVSSTSTTDHPHTGAFRTCSEQPCHGARRAAFTHGEDR